MPSIPDVPTLRLCSILASTAFVVVYLSLWRARTQQSYLLDWAGSFALYAVTLIGFAQVGHHPVLAGLLCCLLGVANVLVLTGVYRFDGVKPFRPWMLLVILLPGLGVLGPGAMGYRVAAEIGGTLGLIFDMLTIGMVLIGGRGMTSSGGRRIAGLALLGYIPGYVLVIVALVTDRSIPDVVALVPMLADQMLLAILNLGLIAMLGERAQMALRHIALRDTLTGALNRAGLAAYGSALAAPETAVVAIDVDHFKAINDRHGHGVGDAVLVALATCAMRRVSGRDLVVRLGGDEFVIVLAGTGRGDVLTFAADLRRAFGAVPDLPAWTASMGVATVAPGETDLLEAIARADRALYEAKASGRDRAAA
ncbi:GGDEF domain-containing protein [Methylobacterium sp. J-090]|uniref:GGDEF domain-containing protein n=1 Tax=Methylobacterium sp. J-090 TaxID=2836666 RepID=UPI001FB9D9F6|nr:GGDEF domain-containing protein [Methylobacterium sp. J-090]MCJ2083462.1 GGDEF domain-containing protein [Methylobacterium sp. J-090]